MKQTIPRSARILRWIARIWSLLLAAVVFLLFSPALMAPLAGNAALPAMDILLISLFALATLALLLAWRWERAGAWLAIAATIVQQLAFSVSKGIWDPGQLIQSALFLAPAVMYLFASKLSRGWT